MYLVFIFWSPLQENVHSLCLSCTIFCFYRQPQKLYWAASFQISNRRQQSSRDPITRCAIPSSMGFLHMVCGNPAYSMWDSVIWHMGLRHMGCGTLSYCVWDSVMLRVGLFHIACGTPSYGVSVSDIWRVGLCHMACGTLLYALWDSIIWPGT